MTIPFLAIWWRRKLRHLSSRGLSRSSHFSRRDYIKVILDPVPLGNVSQDPPQNGFLSKFEYLRKKNFTCFPSHWEGRHHISFFLFFTPQYQGIQGGSVPKLVLRCQGRGEGHMQLGYLNWKNHKLILSSPYVCVRTHTPQLEDTGWSSSEVDVSSVLIASS